MIPSNYFNVITTVITLIYVFYALFYIYKIDVDHSSIPRHNHILWQHNNPQSGTYLILYLIHSIYNFHIKETDHCSIPKHIHINGCVSSLVRYGSKIYIVCSIFVHLSHVHSYNKHRLNVFSKALHSYVTYNLFLGQGSIYYKQLCYRIFAGILNTMILQFKFGQIILRLRSNVGQYCNILICQCDILFYFKQLRCIFEAT